MKGSRMWPEISSQTLIRCCKWVIGTRLEVPSS